MQYDERLNRLETSRDSGVAEILGAKLWEVELKFKDEPSELQVCR